MRPEPASPRTFQADDPLRDVFVVGVDSDADLFHAASQWGLIVLYARVMMSAETGRSRGFGFVRYATPEEARKGVRLLDGSHYRSRVLHAAHVDPVRVATSQKRSTGPPSRSRSKRPMPGFRPSLVVGLRNASATAPVSSTIAASLPRNRSGD